MNWEVRKDAGLRVNEKNNVRKESRQSGKAYKKMSERQFKYKDCSKCSRKCNENFTEEEARRYFEKFWNMKDVVKQRQYLDPLIREVSKERRNTCY
jgi:hypothetical protein